MGKTLIGGETTVTIPEGTVAALESLNVSVTGYGRATLSFDASGDLLAHFPITGGYVGASDEILHQKSGLTFSDAHGKITISDFRIDTADDIVYGDVSLQTGSTNVNENNVDIFSIGSGLSLNFTDDAIGAVNTALGSMLTTAVPVGTAAPAPIANPLPVWLEESPFVRHLFHDYGFHGGVQPIVDGRTYVTLTSASTLSSLGVEVQGLGTAVIRSHGDSPVAIFDITGGSEQSTGDVILHDGSGLRLARDHHAVALRDFVVDTIHDVVDARVAIDGKFAADIAVFDIGSGGSLSLTSAAASALDTTLGLGNALSSSTVVGTASAHPFALTQHEAAVLGALSTA